MSNPNDYDNFAAKRQQALLTGQNLPHRFVEKPAMNALLPDLTGKEVLMVGCGTGEESVLLETHGATHLQGVDLSAESVRLAAQSYPEHTFQTADMHNLPFEDNTFDFIYSSLTVHYSAEPEKVYKEIGRVLKLGGVFQFSVGHPMRWASERVTIDGKSFKVMGYSEGPTPVTRYSEPVKRLGDYSGFNQFDETFSGGEVLQFYIGPPSMHFGLLRKAGFTVTDFVETKATEECKEVAPDYYSRFGHFPQFVVFSAQKTS